MTRRSQLLSAIAACAVLIGTSWLFVTDAHKTARQHMREVASPSAVQVRPITKSRQTPLRVLPLKNKVQVNAREVARQVTPDEFRAAQQALTGVMRCKWAADAELQIRSELDRPIAQDAAESAKSAGEEKIQLLQDNLTRLTAIRANCANQSAEELDKDVYDKLLAAARMGDRNAATCYIVAPYEAPALQANPASFDEYNRNAANLIEVGMAAGNWNMVYALEIGTSPSRGESGWFDSLLIHDELTTYKYKRLRRLGTIEQEAATLDAELAGQARRLIIHGAVSSDDIGHADQWAQTVYETYFANAERLTETPALCQDPTGGLQGVVM